MPFATRRLAVVLVLVPAVVLAACLGDGDDGPGDIGGNLLLATTTSTEDSGLLEELTPIFEDQTGVNVRVIGVGTGAALEMAATGDADAVLAHAPALEQEYIDKGHLVETQLVMYNDFVIVGPPADPRDIAATTSIGDALKTIAADGPFVSRGDGSGTHAMELDLWADVGIDPTAVPLRDETGQGMGATLNVADQKRAYALADRGTFLALRHNLELEILFEGDASLRNIYHVHAVNPDRHDGVQVEQATAWLEFLVSDEAQALIETFGTEEFGEPLFTPAAGQTLEELGG